MEMETRSLEGKVVQETVSQGSKSERQAIVLHSTDGKDYVLRRQGGPAFVDPGLEPLVGHSIKADGLVVDQLFVLQNWELSD
jgi:hypothetical protein